MEQTEAEIHGAMTYDYHTTTMEDRRILLGTKYEWKKIKPSDLAPLKHEADRAKQMVWEEASGRYYELDYAPIYETLEQLKTNRNIDVKNTSYYKYWMPVKGEDYCMGRLTRLIELFDNMKNGFDKNAGAYGGVCAERTGEKLDGSHRAIVAQFYGIKEIEIKEFAFDWKSISWAWVKRRLQAAELGLGPNYYLIDYGDFKNISTPLPYVYTENSEGRWPIIKHLLKGTVLDLGCNEGFMSVKAALHGHKAHGVDYKFIGGAWMNKLIFEKLNKKTLDVDFETADLNSYKITGKWDTCLLLNTIYHLKNKKELMHEIRKHCKQVIMQGNMRKMREHERFYGITAEDMRELMEAEGYNVTIAEWGDKPIAIGI